jgi:hexokinase
MKKAPTIAAKEGSSIINIESGGYSKAPRGEMDVILDKGTTDPGRQQFEKMISGAYQGTLIFDTLKQAAKDGIFSNQFVSRLNEIQGLSSREIDDFCFYPYGDNALAKCVGTGNSTQEKEDRLKLYYIIDVLIERAAKLVAINIASVILKSGKGQDPSMPVCVAADGTTFYKSKLFRGKLDYYVKEYMNEKMGIYCEFVKAENANLVGTAIAGLLN